VALLYSGRLALQYNSGSYIKHRGEDIHPTKGKEKAEYNFKYFMAMLWCFTMVIKPTNAYENK
jgi:hypothetical protein